MAKQAAKKAAEVKAEAKYPCTAAQLRAARKDGLSWKKVADRFKLGSPATARRAWVEVVGAPHTEAPQLERGGRPAGSGNGNGENAWTPIDLTEATTVAALRKAIQGAVVRVQPIRSNGKPRQFLAAKVAKLTKGDTPEFELTDAEGNVHTVRVDKVDATRPQQ